MLDKPILLIRKPGQNKHLHLKQNKQTKLKQNKRLHLKTVQLPEDIAPLSIYILTFKTVIVFIHLRQIILNYLMLHWPNDNPWPLLYFIKWIQLFTDEKWTITVSCHSVFCSVQIYRNIPSTVSVNIIYIYIYNFVFCFFTLRWIWLLLQVKELTLSVQRLWGNPTFLWSHAHNPTGAQRMQEISEPYKTHVL